MTTEATYRATIRVQTNGLVPDELEALAERIADVVEETLGGDAERFGVVWQGDWAIEAVR